MRSRSRTRRSSKRRQLRPGRSPIRRVRLVTCSRPTGFSLTGAKVRSASVSPYCPVLPERLTRRGTKINWRTDDQGIEDADVVAAAFRAADLHDKRGGPQQG